MAVKPDPLSDVTTKQALVYIPFIGWIPALGFLFAEKNHDVVWQASQSLILHVVVAAVYMVVLPLLRLTVLLIPVAWFLQGAVGVGFVLFMMYALVQVRNGKEVRVPLVAEWADKLAKTSHN